MIPTNPTGSCRMLHGCRLASTTDATAVANTRTSKRMTNPDRVARTSTAGTTIGGANTAATATTRSQHGSGSIGWRSSSRARTGSSCGCNGQGTIPVVGKGGLGNDIGDAGGGPGRSCVSHGRRDDGLLLVGLSCCSLLLCLELGLLLGGGPLGSLLLGQELPGGLFLLLLLLLLLMETELGLFLLLLLLLLLQKDGGSRRRRLRRDRLIAHRHITRHVAGSGGIGQKGIGIGDTAGIDVVATDIVAVATTATTATTATALGGQILVGGVVILVLSVGNLEGANAGGRSRGLGGRR